MFISIMLCSCLCFALTFHHTYSNILVSTSVLKYFRQEDELPGRRNRFYEK